MTAFGHNRIAGARVSGFFQVDMDVLGRFITALRQSGDQTDAALRAMASATAGQIGTGALDAAADDFQHTWHYGVKQIRSMIGETTEGAGQAHDTYQQVEDGLRGALDQMRAAF